MKAASFRGVFYLINRAGICKCLAASCALIALFAAGLRARTENPQVQIPLTIAKGVPLRITLVKRVPIAHSGEPVEGRLADSVYVYDVAVLPAGSEILGHVMEVRSVSRLIRARAIMNGNFTPLRTAKVEFDTLVLKDGRRIPISTLVMPGAAPTIQLVSGGNKKSKRMDPVSGIIAGERQQFSAEKNEIMSELRSPGKMGRLKAKLKRLVIAESPYHHQAFEPGTVFTAELLAPIKLGVESLPASALANAGSPPPPDCIIHARLLTSLDSATTHRGAPVSAVVTKPLFSSKQQLIIPQGSRLEGMVVRAKPARILHRNGNLRFTFQRLEPPAAPVEIIQASVQGVEVARSSRLKLDEEGGAAPAASKARYVAPVLSLMLAAHVATPDRDAVRPGSVAAVPGQGGAVGQALAGGWGFGLVGSALSLAAQSRVLTAALGFYGAAWSVYSNLLTRGRDVVFPVNTPIEIRLGSHERRASRSALPAAPHG